MKNAWVQAAAADQLPLIQPVRNHACQIVARVVIAHHRIKRDKKGQRFSKATIPEDNQCLRSLFFLRPPSPEQLRQALVPSPRFGLGWGAEFLALRAPGGPVDYQGTC